MGSQRTHHVITTDGVTIAGTVHGQGPPIVFLPGAYGDGDIDWNRVVQHLADRFTCHLPSMRGRGLSSDHPDLGLDRVIDDWVGHVESLGRPTGLVGWSGGASHALAVAARSDAVTAVAPVEPVANSVFDEQEQAALGEAVARAGELAGQGNLTAAMRAFAEFPFNEEDIATAEQIGYFEANGRYAPHMLNFFQQFTEYRGPTPDDPAVLGAISVPVLVLHGSDTKPYAVTSARHVVDHVPDARRQEIPGAGHASPLTHPRELADALAEFFTSAGRPA